MEAKVKKITKFRRDMLDIYYLVDDELYGLHECFVDGYRCALRCYKNDLDHGPKIYFEYGKQ
jgi:hypothetical protein